MISLGTPLTKIFIADNPSTTLCVQELGVIVAWEIIFSSLSQYVHKNKGENIKEASKMFLEAFLETIPLAGTGKHRQISQQGRCHMPFACPEKYKRTRENVTLCINRHPPQPSKVFLILHVWIYELVDMVSLENILCILCTSKTSHISGESHFSAITISPGKEAVYAGLCEIPKCPCTD